MNKGHIQNGVLCYTQGKTGKKMSVPIGNELHAIFSRYMIPARHCIFPMFDDGDQINERTINSRITYINKYIREVCKYAGVMKKISTHCSRHSFLDHALSAGGNIYEVKELAGHSSVKTTEAYLRQRVNSAAEVITAKVYERIADDKLD